MNREATATALKVWLVARAELAPPSLRLRLADAVAAVGARPTGTLGDLLSHAGERLLAKLLAEGCGDREAAPDLLTADALVTYAFEAEADDESHTAKAIDASAARAMARVAAFGAAE